MVAQRASVARQPAARRAAREAAPLAAGEADARRRCKTLSVCARTSSVRDASLCRFLALKIAAVHALQARPVSRMFPPMRSALSRTLSVSSAQTQQ